MNGIRFFSFLSILTIFAGCKEQKPDNYIATGTALEKYDELLSDRSFFLYAESRERPIRWYDSIPEVKIGDSGRVFTLSANPGEVFIYQLGVWALRSDINDVKIEFSDLLTGNNKRMISSDRMTCYNKGGINHLGKPFDKELRISTGRIQALWIGIDLDGISEGIYHGGVSVTVDNRKQTIPLKLRLTGKVVANHGYDEGKRLARLNWLNATVGIDNHITRDFEPVKVSGNQLTILGRTITISANGLPGSITSFFHPSNSTLMDKGNPVINKPIRFIIEKENGEVVMLEPGELKFEAHTDSEIRWSVLNSSAEFSLNCIGQLEFDGFVDFKLELLAKADARIRDIRLEISMDEERAEYMMGLGHEGGIRKPDWEWRWDITKHQDKLWVGTVNGGLRVKWKAENYVRPLINVYYGFRPLKLPASWGNDNKGGVQVTQKEDDVRIIAYSGKRKLRRGDVLHYDFELLITPFKLISKEKKYGDRYYHGGGTDTSFKIEKAKKAGANVINIHHAEDIYPFINYPYQDDQIADLSQLVTDAHSEGMRMKFYYTTRELTKNLPEFDALVSLNGEVIFPGPGNECRTWINKEGPHEWLIKNLRENYIPAWSSLIKHGKFEGITDLSVITTPDSRLNNFYVAGLDWMMKHIGNDGIYIDDSALDRFTVRRARKIIDKYRSEGRIDFHSVNHYDERYGFANCLNLYMDLLPYFDLVWIGEGRDYDRMPDHWLIEVSGIPFGLSGQMLQGGGNRWRGMVYGITSRPGWFDPAPTGIWNCWDEYNIQDKTMIGYWEDGSPLSCDHPMVRATIYKGDQESLIALANWSEDDLQVALQVDFSQLGYDQEACDLFIPEIPDFQEEFTSVNLNRLILPGGKGYIIILRNKRF